MASSGTPRFRCYDTRRCFFARRASDARRSVTDNLAFSLNATMPVFLLMAFGMVLRRIRVRRRLRGAHERLRLPCGASRAAVRRHSRRSTLPANGTAPRCGMPCHHPCKHRHRGGGVFFRAREKPARRIHPIVLPQQRGTARRGAYAEHVRIVGHGGAHDRRRRSLYNVAAVVALTFFGPCEGPSCDMRSLAKRSLRDIAANPIILGIAAGFAYAASDPCRRSRKASSAASAASPRLSALSPWGPCSTSVAPQDGSSLRRRVELHQACRPCRAVSAHRHGGGLSRGRAGDDCGDARVARHGELLRHGARLGP